ncbi:MAG: hypothetical protein OHK003_22930 [Anaerolineales bacterium]
MTLKVRIVAIIGIFALLLAQLMYDPISAAKHSLTVERVRVQFSEANEKWNAAVIEDYSFEIQGSSQNICAVDAVIEVRNNIVTEVRPFDSASPLPPEKWADPDWGNEVFLCDYSHFTIPRIFDMIEQIIRNSPSSILSVKFDPQHGFVTSFKDGIFTSNGWLSPKFNGIHNEFQIANFQPH